MASLCYPGRKFQLWEYHVSHGLLLIRAPRDDRFRTNVDIMFFDVTYMAVPRFFRGELGICDPRPEDVENVKKILDRNVPSSSVYILTASERRFVVVAAILKIEENELEIMDSPFDLSFK